MMMESPPAAALEMVEPELILEFLIVALDTPAQFGEADQISERRRLRQGREPILRGLRVAPRPLNQQPLVRPGLRALLIAMGGPHAQSRAAREPAASDFGACASRCAVRGSAAGRGPSSASGAAAPRPAATPSSPSSRRRRTPAPRW